MTDGPVMTLSRERRSEARNYSIGQSPGINRLKTLVDTAFKKHDEQWQDADPAIWQSQYSLRNHSAMVTKVSMAVSEKRGASDTEQAIIASAAQFHDRGKLFALCCLYRLDRRLTLAERRTVNKHARYSAEYVRKCMKMVREEDRPFLKLVEKVVRWHHKPWFIFNRRLRALGWNLWLADIFVAKQENRHQPGLTQIQALEIIPRMIRENAPLVVRVAYWLEIRRSLNALQELYSLKSFIA